MISREFKYKEVDTEGLETLKALEEASNFNQWMYDSIKPFCAGKILEIGSGIGNISHFFVKEKYDIFLSDIRNNYRVILKEIFPSISDKILDIDLLDKDFDKKYLSILGSFDTVFALNVIEHIKDDGQAIINCKKLLKKEGKLIILVPAFNSLYNGIDKNLEHYKRYTKKTLLAIITPHLKVNETFYFNTFGILGWFLFGSVFRKTELQSTEISIYNKILPITKFFDKIFRSIVGLSVVAVATKE